MQLGPATRLALQREYHQLGQTWNSRRSSSTHVTMVGEPPVMPATIPDTGSSPARANNVCKHFGRGTAPALCEFQVLGMR
jgi:hypothetical protein